MKNEINQKILNSISKMIDIDLKQLENKLIKLEENKNKLEQLKKQNKIYLIILTFIFLCEICLFIKMLSF